MGRCEDKELENIEIDKKYIRNMENSSKGTQLKFFKDNVWYKQNNMGYEGKAEVLCSLFVQYTNISEFVTYKECRINGRLGSRSENFLQDGEECITLQRLYEFYMGGHLNDAVLKYEKVEDRIAYVLEFVEKATNLDLKKYLSQMLTLDMITLNTDRHFHNICVIRKADGKYRMAPIFDNGAALLSNFAIFPIEKELEENIECAVAAPFSGSFERQAEVLGMNLTIKTELLHALEEYSDCRAKQVLTHQLHKYRFLFERTQA